ncbi:hypothetical protein C8J56DRAFT_104826 [Mycena floridula]|nr:hypothetical protein C8J56DRAFT_104826 [Mycena floridula]
MFRCSFLLFFASRYLKAVSFPPWTYSLALNASMELDLCVIGKTKEESKKSMLQFLLWAYVIMRYVQYPRHKVLNCK